jgi:hypothetical protein
MRIEDVQETCCWCSWIPRSDSVVGVVCAHEGGTLSPPHQWVSVRTPAIDFYFRSHFETLETVGNSFKATGKVSVENTMFDYC